jgi:hypothetical protein
MVGSLAEFGALPKLARSTVLVPSIQMARFQRLVLSIRMARSVSMVLSGLMARSRIVVLSDSMAQGFTALATAKAFSRSEIPPFDHSVLPAAYCFIANW